MKKSQPVDEFTVKHDSNSTPDVDNLSILTLIPSTIPIPKPKAKATDKQYLRLSIICSLISISGFVVGWDTGTIGGVINMPTFKETFASYDTTTKSYAFTDMQTGLVSGFYGLAAMFGSILLPKLVGMIGKRQNLIVCNFIYIIGICVFITSISNFYQLFIGRLILGFAVGGLSALAPSLVAEMSPVEIRGTLISMYQVLSCFGIAASSVVAYASEFFKNSAQWRFPMGLSLLWQFIMLAGLFMAPESQSFLILKGKRHEAFENLRKMYPHRPDEELYDMLNIMELDLTGGGLQESSGKKAGSIDFKYMIFGKPKILYRLISGMLIQAFQGLTGINYFFYYSTSIFNGIGLENSFVSSMILTCVYAATSFLAIPVASRFDRKTITIAGTVFILIFLSLFTALTTTVLYPDPLDTSVTSPAVGKLVIFVTCCYVLTFSVSWGPMAYVIMAEIYPLKLNKIGVSFAMASQWAFTFMISFLTPFITSKIGFKYGLIFIVSMIFALFFVIFGIPETKNKTFEEIDQIYSENNVFWKTFSTFSTKPESLELASGSAKPGITKPTSIELPDLPKNSSWSHPMTYSTEATPINEFTSTAKENKMDYFSESV